MNPELIWRLLDVTSLNPTDTDSDIKRLCQTAKTLFDPTDASSHAAAVCCYPKFCALAKAELAGCGVKVATVVNFPDGEQDPFTVKDDIATTIADEIDVVFAYKKFLAGDSAACMQELKFYRKAAGGRCLKVILETAAFPDAVSLRAACDLAIAAGADFLKTSTGFGPGGASQAAVRVLLQAIVNKDNSAQDVGIKVSGGVKTLAKAQDFLAEISKFIAVDQIKNKKVRIGASSLANDIIGHATS